MHYGDFAVQNEKQSFKRRTGDTEIQRTIKNFKKCFILAILIL